MMAERLPETCRVVIPIKLEFSASVGFIHREHREVSRNGVWHLNSSHFHDDDNDNDDDVDDDEYGSVME